jgi:hypothetical protein
VALTSVRSLTNLWSALRASRVVHHRALTALVRAPVTWFDTTPVGRILNRFSKVSARAAGLGGLRDESRAHPRLRADTQPSLAPACVSLIRLSCPAGHRRR